MDNIKIYDHFLEKQIYFKLVEFLYTTKKYSFGEIDNPKYPPVGLIADFTDNIIFPLTHVVSEINKLISPDLNLDRIYCNCFAPNELPYFHTDSDNSADKTAIIYISDRDWSLNDCGETQFYENGNIIGIVPRSNRLIIFDSNIRHRATSYRDRHRFTLAIKYRI